MIRNTIESNLLKLPTRRSAVVHLSRIECLTSLSLADLRLRVEDAIARLLIVIDALALCASGVGV